MCDFVCFCHFSGYYPPLPGGRSQVPATTWTTTTMTTTTNPRRPPGGRQRQDTGHLRPRRRPLAGHPRHRPGHPRRRRRYPCRRPGHLRLRHPRLGIRLFVRWNSTAATTAATNVPTSRLVRQRQTAPRDASLPWLARGTVPTRIYLRGGPRSLPESFRRGLRAGLLPTRKVQRSPPSWRSRMATAHGCKVYPFKS